MPIEAMRQAARRGDPEALCGLVLVALGESENTLDPGACIALLMQAAKAGFAPALRCLGLAAFESGDRESAQDWFALAWSRGDPLAAMLMALIVDDPNRSQSLHALALSAGIARASFHVVGTPAAARIDEPHVLPNAPDPACFGWNCGAVTSYRAEPRLLTCDSVLSPLECEYVIALAAPTLQPSTVHNPLTGASMRHPARTSQSTAFPGHDGDIWLRQLQRRLALLAGMSFLQGERLAVLRYGRGEEYRPHRDYLRGDDLIELRADRPGQRLTTAFCYLNAVQAGGATDFPLLATRIHPCQGRVVLFDNVRADGSPDPDTLHAGLPVEQGEKWLATLWFRERRLRPF